MVLMIREPSRSKPQAEAGESWPLWARRTVSCALAVHFTAVFAANLAVPPSSALERAVAALFGWYYQLTDQGQAHRYYTEIPPTPIVIARLRFDDGRPEQLMRLPDRALRLRLSYQRQLALAHHLYVEFDQSRTAPEGARGGRWAGSYARHLCRTTPHCASVTLLVHFHLFPDPAAPGRGVPLNADLEEEYTVPERIGEFSCQAL
jgi:hypothetical protein